ncbi:MAG: hypothetical protein MPK31_09475, partial [Gammaproteobacteria bacterium]|nr:hypothetical protein [Gammaproteobacteria bacterium]
GGGAGIEITVEYPTDFDLRNFDYNRRDLEIGLYLLNMNQRQGQTAVAPHATIRTEFFRAIVNSGWRFRFAPRATISVPSINFLLLTWGTFLTDRGSLPATINADYLTRQQRNARLGTRVGGPGFITPIGDTQPSPAGVTDANREQGGLIAPDDQIRIFGTTEKLDQLEHLLSSLVDGTDVLQVEFFNRSTNDIAPVQVTDIVDLSVTGQGDTGNAIPGVVRRVNNSDMRIPDDNGTSGDGTNPVNGVSYIDVMLTNRGGAFAYPQPGSGIRFFTGLGGRLRRNPFDGAVTPTQTDLDAGETILKLVDFNTQADGTMLPVYDWRPDIQGEDARLLIQGTFPNVAVTPGTFTAGQTFLFQGHEYTVTQGNTFTVPDPIPANFADTLGTAVDDGTLTVTTSIAANTVLVLTSAFANDGRGRRDRGVFIWTPNDTDPEQSVWTLVADIENDSRVEVNPTTIPANGTVVVLRVATTFGGTTYQPGVYVSNGTVLELIANDVDTVYTDDNWDDRLSRLVTASAEETATINSADTNAGLTTIQLSADAAVTIAAGHFIRLQRREGETVFSYPTRYYRIDSITNQGRFIVDNRGDTLVATADIPTNERVALRHATGFAGQTAGGGGGTALPFRNALDVPGETFNNGDYVSLLEDDGTNPRGLYIRDNNTWRAVATLHQEIARVTTLPDTRTTEELFELLRLTVAAGNNAAGLYQLTAIDTTVDPADLTWTPISLDQAEDARFVVDPTAFPTTGTIVFLTAQTTLGLITYDEGVYTATGTADQAATALSELQDSRFHILTAIPTDTSDLNENDIIFLTTRDTTNNLEIGVYHWDAVNTTAIPIADISALTRTGDITVGDYAQFTGDDSGVVRGR